MLDLLLLKQLGEKEMGGEGRKVRIGQDDDGKTRRASEQQTERDTIDSLLL